MTHDLYQLSRDLHKQLDVAVEELDEAKIRISELEANLAEAERSFRLVRKERDTLWGRLDEAMEAALKGTSTHSEQNAALLAQVTGLRTALETMPSPGKGSSTEEIRGAFIKYYEWYRDQRVEALAAVPDPGVVVRREVLSDLIGWADAWLEERGADTEEMLKEAQQALVTTEP